MHNRWDDVIMTGDSKHPDWQAARGLLMDALRASGIGAEIETRAIEAFRAGVPAALHAGGTSKSWPDGTSVTYEPNRPPVVRQGRATLGDLAALPGRPHVDTTPAGVLMQQAWAGIEHQGTRGCRVSTPRLSPSYRVSRSASPVPARQGPMPSFIAAGRRAFRLPGRCGHPGMTKPKTCPCCGEPLSECTCPWRD